MNYYVLKETRGDGDVVKLEDMNLEEAKRECISMFGSLSSHDKKCSIYTLLDEDNVISLQDSGSYNEIIQLDYDNYPLYEFIEKNNLTDLDYKRLEKLYNNLYGFNHFDYIQDDYRDNYLTNSYIPQIEKCVWWYMDESKNLAIDEDLRIYDDEEMKEWF